MLEQKGVRNELVAWFPWGDAKGAKRCLADTVGIFLLGGRQKVQLPFPPTILTSAVAELLVVPTFTSPDGMFMGMQLSQFWGCRDEGAALERLTLRVHNQYMRTREWPWLPKCKQKEMWEDALGERGFQNGVHKRLRAVLWAKPRTPHAALSAREQKDKTRKRKRHCKDEGKGNGSRIGVGGAAEQEQKDVANAKGGRTRGR